MTETTSASNDRAMRPKRITTESPLAESSVAETRTEGSHQRIVSRLVNEWKTVAEDLVKAAIETRKYDPSAARRMVVRSETYSECANRLEQEMVANKKGQP